VRGRALVTFAFVLALAGCGGDDSEQAAPTQTEASSSGTGCRQVDQPQPKGPGAEERPTKLLDADKTYKLVMKTNCGDFTITLDQKSAPQTTASLVSLADHDFFDDTFFHRIVPGFVIQGGDPTGSGSGGPGYSTIDPPAAGTTYEHGVVAMAKTGAEPPGTSGSQFFVVTAPDAGLPPDYAVVGKITEGLDVVDRIGRLGDAAEQPTQPVVIEDVEVETS
jgi:peptidyl-prolyl cis-trans isomerase B (cyclophilin B)